MTDDALDHEAVAELLPAYALHAVERHEAQLVRDHAQRCPRCRSELDAWCEIASSLHHRSVEVPEYLWDRIVQQMPEAEPQGPSDPSSRLQGLSGGVGPAPVVHVPTRGATCSGARRRGTRRYLRRSTGLVAASLVLLAALGIEVGRLEHQLAQQQNAARTWDRQSGSTAILANPGHLTVPLYSGTGQEVAQVIAVNGRGYLEAEAMAALPDSESYQLWGVIEGQPVSLGLLGPHPHIVAFSYGRTSPTTLMVTVEPAGGVTTPDSAPVAQGSLS